MFFLFFQNGSKFGKIGGNHGLSSSEDDVITVPLRDPFKNFRYRHFRSFWFPGSVGSVAPVTAQVAAGGADKDGGNSSQETFSLNRVEDFRYPHGIRLLEWVWEAEVGW